MLPLNLVLVTRELCVGVWHKLIPNLLKIQKENLQGFVITVKVSLNFTSQNQIVPKKEPNKVKKSFKMHLL